MIRTAFSRKLRDANFRFAMIGIGLCVVLLILTTRIGDKRVDTIPPNACAAPHQPGQNARLSTSANPGSLDMNSPS